ncbi:MAG: hypothetical protein AAGG07_00785 [Planctomycetota bacterium]
MRVEREFEFAERRAAQYTEGCFGEREDDDGAVSPIRIEEAAADRDPRGQFERERCD